MISCRDTSALVSKSLDERLPWPVRMQVRLHLLMCSACRNFESQMLLLRSACAEIASGRRTAPQRTDAASGRPGDQPPAV